MSLCSNHNNLPCYNNLLITSSKRIEPTKIRDNVSVMNKTLIELNPRKKELVKMVQDLALPVIGFITITTTALFFFSVSYLTIASIAVLGIFKTISIGNTILNYRKYQKECQQFTEDRNELYKTCKQEFILLEQKIIPLIPINQEDMQRISPHLGLDIGHNPLPYKVREQTHCKLEGGKIGDRVNEPLQLTEVCQINNFERVAAKYKPWIDLLIELSKFEQVPANLLYFIGKMAGFNRGVIDARSFENENYIIMHRKLRNQDNKPAEEVISCYDKNDSTKSITIRTPQECLDFVQKNFLKQVS